MNEERHTEKNITDELSRLGQQMADAIHAAWESEDRKKLQSEISEGLKKFSDQVSEALDKAGKSDAAHQVKTQAQKVAAEVKESDVTEEVRRGFLTGLEALNHELSKLLAKLEGHKEPPPTPPTPPAQG